jgi:hypothetical protein
VASFLFHASLLVVLAVVAQTVRPGASGSFLTLVPGDVESLDLAPEERSWEFDPNDWHYRRPGPTVPETEPAVPEVKPYSETAAASGAASGPQSPLWLPATEGPFASGPAGGGLEGRTPEGRARLIGDGGTEASEAAVEKGLRWLAAHQQRDGSWNFNHQLGPCKGLCRNPGDVASTTGSTAMALAPFLGAGYTYENPEHGRTVRDGLYYLKNRARVVQEGVDLQEGTMYAQGLAAIVLSEGYAMTGDQSLKYVAQQAVDFIDYAQDKRGGGWRYSPGEPGDMTVTGWQLMALKSAQMAGLDVSQSTVYGVDRFLSSLQSEEGALYGYMDTAPRESTTAIGLLCRMYRGWGRDYPPLAAGVKHLSTWGPSENDMYFNYYATQVLRHWEGPLWEAWNTRMRDYLIETQARYGHEHGSWFFNHPKTNSGGRLYDTAMAIMILEVYYRYMPLYGQGAFGE